MVRCHEDCRADRTASGLFVLLAAVALVAFVLALRLLDARRTLATCESFAEVVRP